MSLRLHRLPVILLVLAAIGMPIALAMILAAIGYVGFAGQDLSLPAEQLTLGLYDNFIILAVPLFIVAANIMNAGSISDRLLRFCVALVGRFRGGLGLVNVVANIIFAGMSGSAVADAAGLGKVIIDMMRKDGRYPPRLCRRDHRRRLDHRADHPAIDPDGDVFAGLRRLDRRALRRRHHPRVPDGPDADDHELVDGAAPQLRPRRAGAGPRAAAGSPSTPSRRS